MNYVFLMAGEGKRFKDQGYPDDKPMIPVNGVRMIDLVLENRITPKLLVNYKPRFIFVCQQSFVDKYGKEFKQITEKHGIITEIRTVSKLTRGAAETLTTISDIIDERPMIIDDCDHCGEEGHIYRGLEYFINNKCDGGFWNFISGDPKYSFIRLNNGNVEEVVEKRAISNIANTGTYFADSGSQFIRYAKEIIAKDIRVNNEFYISPVYTSMIADGAKVRNYMINGFSGLGTPSDLEKYVNETKPS